MNDTAPQPNPGVPAIRALPRQGQAPAPRRPLSRFIGRERELAAIAALIETPGVRLLTLAGPGGIGKTRLAWAVAEWAGARFDRVWLVELAEVRDLSMVAPTVARALGLRDATPALDREIALRIRDGSALLVLDNVEQVPEIGLLVVDLLRACPSLTVLVTSRVSLRVSGEHLYAVPPLALPPAGGAGGPEAIRASDAVALFVARAAERAPGFALTDDTAGTVAGICRDLDGLPLAIELAAARVAALSPATIRDRLDARLALLAEGPRDQPPRLRSMRDSIAWSHDLLERAEQALFARLAVFAGSWTLDAAEAVVWGDDLPVLEGIATLVNGNLVRRVDARGDDSRYAMLETIREFAVERLAGSGEEPAMRARHAAHVSALAAANGWAWFRSLDEGTVALGRLEAAHADFRAALDWLWRTGDHAAVLRLAGDLAGLWCVCGHAEEGRGWLERGLGAAGDAGASVAGHALGVLSWVCVLTGQPGRAREYAERGLALLESEPASMAEVLCLAELGMAARQLGAFEVAFTRQREAMAVLERIDADAAPRDVTRNWRISLEAGLGHSAMLQGDVDRAAEHYEMARDLQVAGGFAPGASHILGSHIVAGLGDVARARGDAADALRQYRTSLEQAWRSSDARAIAQTIGGVAGSLAALGRHREAATLFGAAEIVHETHGFTFARETLDRQRALGLPEPWARAGEPCGAWEALREAVGTSGHVPMPAAGDADAAADAWQAGRRLALEDAVALAIAVETAEASPAEDRGLSTREVEVLRLLAAGMTDPEIAAGLYISRHTVATHVRHIFDKLGVSSRAAAAAAAVRSGLG